MSLFSRNTEGGRRGLARMAAVFAGTLLTYLVVTAIPAFAATTCASATVDLPNDKLEIAVGTDDKVVVAVVVDWEISINGAAFGADCPATATVAAVDWIEITGSDAGAETVSAYDPSGAFSAINTTVDLGNGTDTFIFQYAALTTPVLADAGNADLGLGTADDGTINGGEPISGTSDFRIDDAENIVVNGSNTLGAGDELNLSDDSQGGFSVVTGTADDTQATTGPVTQNVTFNAGSGDDTLVSGDGADNFQAGAGDDTIDYSGASADVTADLTAATGTGQGNDILSDVQDVVGSDFDDTITGSALDNTISGGAGDDVIDAGAGNDTVDGGAGDDTLNEGAAANGTDTLAGGSGGEVVGDTLNYGARTTAIVVRPGGGAVSGASGELDTLATDFENYMTGSGNDTLTGTGSPESFDPGSGTNTVVGGAGPGDNLDLSSQTGPAAIVLSAGAGTATAGTTVDTYSGIESFTGTSADDTLTWDGTGALLTFNGGDGVDSIDASSATVAVVIALPVTTENATGGSGADTLTGNILGNALVGNAGADTINGLGGNDWIEGGLGNDLLNTGAGNTGADTLVYINATGGEVIDNQLGFATGPDGEDSLGFFAIILGSDFADEILAGQTFIDLNQRIRGRGGNDTITGSNSSDALFGGGGNDSIRAGAGDDTVKGAAGNDVMFGSGGDDFLFGGKGSDTGDGGRGDDTCRGVEFATSC